METGDDRRECIVTRESRPRPALIRFVTGPDGSVVPDVAEKLPGPGLWTVPSRQIIERARQEALFGPAAVPDDLCDRVRDQLRRECLNLLGRARRASQLILGFDQVAGAVAENRAAAIVSASDASPRERARLVGANADLPVFAPFTAAELSLALGRDNVVHAALSRNGLAVRTIGALRRLAEFDEADASISPVENMRSSERSNSETVE